MMGSIIDGVNGMGDVHFVWPLSGAQHEPDHSIVKRRTTVLLINDQS